VSLLFILYDVNGCPVNNIWLIDWLIDWLILSVNRTIFQSYSGREQVPTIYKNYIEMREGCVNRINGYWLPLQKCGALGSESQIYSAKEIFCVQGAWHSLSTLPMYLVPLSWLSVLYTDNPQLSGPPLSTHYRGRAEQLSGGEPREPSLVPRITLGSIS
jgi:hypothetical protein